MPLLSVENLVTHFHTRAGIVRAVEGVSFSLESGETLGIVGESGSGKSVAQYSVLGLLPSPPARVEAGAAHFEGRDLLRCTPRELRTVRGRRIAMIFQDPMTALNPYLRVGAQVMEPLQCHQGLSRREARRHALEALEAVGIQDAAQRIDRYPHEFSGGMRQRVMIAMALITHPALLIADEPTTALDVTVQAQILTLIKQRQRDLGMAVILITHDLGIVAGQCDRVAVMYAGRIMETATTDDLFAQPRHPYTRALMDSLPAAHAPGDDLFTIPGLPPDGIAPFAGCPFAPRCRDARPECHATPCAIEEVAPNHGSACLRVQRGELP
jgi:oligopeptide transport system ATP-binding protein